MVPVPMEMSKNACFWASTPPARAANPLAIARPMIFTRPLSSAREVPVENELADQGDHSQNDHNDVRSYGCRKTVSGPLIVKDRILGQEREIGFHSGDPKIYGVESGHDNDTGKQIADLAFYMNKAGHASGEHACEERER